MKLVHSIGTENHSNYNTREEILECEDTLGFDGIYRNVYENRDVLKGKKGILFVMGDYVGKDNSFDLPNVPKLEKYCDWNEIMELSHETGFEIGWHTWSHSDLTKLSEEEIMKEITPPFPMRTFSYPYGRFNDLVIECVKRAGYDYAWSVTKGDDTPYQLRREYI